MRQNVQNGLSCHSRGEEKVKLQVQRCYPRTWQPPS
uniref:Uncharacterized protein n=1 Tax=Arundo donax TaxID=35708 RepID=A0A0A9AUF7_ARUDO